GKGLADMMITDLSSAPGLAVVEREKLEALLAEIKLERGHYFDPNTAQKLGRGVGAELAVTGSFVAMSPSLRLDVRVIRIDSGKVLKAAQVTGDKEHFFDLYKKLVAELLDGLQAAVSGADAGRVKAAADGNRVENIAAAVDYSKGLELR